MEPQSTPIIQRYAFLYTFADYVKELSGDYNEEPSSTLHSSASQNQQPVPRNKPGSIFGIHNGLLEIMERIYTLHVDANETKTLESDSVVDAVDIWNDLDQIRDGCQQDSLEDSNLQIACVWALYVWLYLIVHPKGAGNEKAQMAVRNGLVASKAVANTNDLPFLLLPAFCLGLATLEQEDRYSVMELFGKIDGSFVLIDTKIYRDIVEEGWQELDRGSERSWG
ncbi:hypothetical protein N7478_012443 [Penicillium angulare]|uniref:uncharacterized protein n=1 Tax=Penicillium angulare TaxID=116970 RepID=UPI00254205CF|nr:uncharacterized protein N7478_012443 [Penicillium angulare]KAJ5259462.1 hypothetical protein N7478_012443 [Penicillium angulare]